MEAALGLDLSSLLTQLAATQQALSAAKLSERNVVELINKLRQLGILSEGELLHTLNGKEYLTVECLRSEIQNALRQAGGRLSLVELPTIVGVDYVHCERQASVIVSESGGTVMEVQGELITTQYFDAIAAEINDQLHEAGQLNIGELAAQYGLATEMVLNMVSMRLGSTITGRLEGGLLYTQSYLRAIKAQLRGALRAAASPALVLNLMRDAGLGATGDAASAGGGGGGAGLAAALASSGGGGVIATLIEELVQEGALRGALKGGGTSWAPAVYGEVQQDAVASFYSQNGWVAYDTVRRKFTPILIRDVPEPSYAPSLGISNERSYLRGTFPDGLPLESAFVSPSLLAALEAAVEDVAAAASTGSGVGSGGGGWVDVAPLLPSVLSEADVAALLGRIPLLRDQERRPAKERKVHVEKADADARTAAHKALQERKASSGAAGTAGAGGGGSGAGAAALPDWFPEMDWGGVDDGKAEAVAQLLLPGAVAAYEEALQAAFTAGAEERRRAKESLARQFEESCTRLLLYGAGVETYADDEATYTALQRHALRTTGAECVDLLYRWARVEHPPEGAEQSAAAGGPASVSGNGPGFLTAAEVKQVLRSVPPDVAEGLAAAADAPGAATVRDAEVLLDRAAAAVGVRAKKLDKKGEKAALAALRERLLSSLASEVDPPAALTLMVPLANMRIMGKAVTLPGKALGQVLSRLQQAAEEGSELAALVRGLGELHEGVVEYLKAQSGGSAAATTTGAMLERLSAMLPQLKAGLGLQEQHQ
ncbi:hypothetical protein VOLCADRAFT_105788 [Volvox carteri f. nagariensis]|uniref:E3 UFM1-protein ligase 1 homolog n=1 Tax=Volvox carteri f. nagariensis TaxID=3068 RepID=D8U326_VOLCA|nr:uncharacterized protein VOLCADRAFT_105788 [Volvox carteri f. nagariensis]EFJ45906.1 hypothetical protein VOLCADRAFT_105788 [Volvox carteri f. nagariensis]|eukprot:XP_002952984.1 hypothetical protein VOLCADRAFT_105788 [Volvox carteri f. nagariensis]